MPESRNFIGATGVNYLGTSECGGSSLEEDRGSERCTTQYGLSNKYTAELSVAWLTIPKMS